MSRCARCGLADELPLKCSSCAQHGYCSDWCAHISWPSHLAREHSDALPQLSRILPRTSTRGELWVGSLRGLSELSVRGIDAVLTLLSPAYDYNETDEALTARVGDRPHLTFRLHDSEESDIWRYFDRGCEFIRRHRAVGLNVLVHCHAGISRSVTMCVCYMTRAGEAPDWRTALDMVRKVRPIANPNDGFRAQLDSYC